MTPDVFAGLLGLLLAALCLVGSIRAGRRQRLVDNLPTSKTTGVFVGLVELKGTAEAERPLISYLAEMPCVYYSYSIEEHWSRTVTEHYTDSKGKSQTRTRHESGWTSVDSGHNEATFYLRDDCGVVRIQPAGAEIQPQAVFSETCGTWNPLYYGKGPRHSVSDSDHRRRFSEVAIPLHAAVYVMGPARERDDVVAPEIRQDRDADLFLISTRTEERIRRGYRATFWSLGILALVLGTLGWFVRDLIRHAHEASVGAYAAAGGGVLAVWLLGWLWMAFNSMINLRQRVRQAWANVDVQLKRRADLIPNLVQAVEGLRDHERQVQTELAELRSQATATAPGEPGPDPRGCAPLLLAIVERYPALKADAAFLDLQRELVATEGRIALAREYFNSIATFYNTRLRTVPDRYLAALGRLQPRPLIGAGEFERAPVRVNLAD